jgi:tetratricopeptide (TPR) repeat protein
MRTLVLILAIGFSSCSNISRGNEMNDKKLPNFNLEWNYSKPEETRVKFEKIYSEVEGEASLDYLLQLKTQIARTYGLQAKFEESHTILDAIERQLTSDTKVAHIRYLLERGRTFNSSDKKVEARELFYKAYEEGKAAKEYTYSVDAAHMVAIAMNDIDQKLEWNRKGLEEAKRSSDPKVNGWVGIFLNNMGWDLFQEKRYSEALEAFESCRDFYKNMENKKRLNVADWSIAKTYRMIGSIDESLKIQLRLIHDNNGDENGYGQEELGELYLLKGDVEKSKKYFGQAYEILSKDVWLVRNEKERLDRMKKLSE